MNFTVIIPARLKSTRLVNKPLQLINNLPMIQYVWMQAKKSQASEIIIATDDFKIKEICENFGAKVCLTSPLHNSGTLRIAEVIEKLCLDKNEIIVNVQGDEPLIPPQFIDLVANNLFHQGVEMTSLATQITNDADLNDPNIVKVVLDKNNCALYFSRSVIPFIRDKEKNIELVKQHKFYRHIGLYAYSAEFVQKYISTPPCQLEILESLEQLRALHIGAKIHITEVAHASPGVDTLEDLEKVRQIIGNQNF